MTCADKKYECEDGHALITDNNWVLLCPPNEKIVSRSPSVLNRIPSLSPSTTVGEYCKDIYYLRDKFCCIINEIYSVDYNCMGGDE